MNPLDFFAYFTAVFVLGVTALTLGRALAARIAGPHADALLNTPIIPISVSLNIALPHRREVEEDQEVSEETGNTTTAETAGNTEETGGETADFMLVNQSGEQNLVTRMTREEYHELIETRVRAIDLLQRCVKYYRENQAADNGVIPRYDKIHMKSEVRGRIVDDLWDSSLVIKSPNKTLVDPAYFPTCDALLKAIVENKKRVYPLGYAERKEQRHMDAVMALPGRERE